MHIIIMPPHIIMQGMPFVIMLIIFMQASLKASIGMPDIGIILHIMLPSAPISQVIEHAIIGIIGIMPPIIGMGMGIGMFGIIMLGIIMFGIIMPGIIMLPIMGIGAALIGLSRSQRLAPNEPFRAQAGQTPDGQRDGPASGAAQARTAPPVLFRPRYWTPRE